ncbi:MAG: OmpA family protein [Deltaproteobacteria bacterium]|nr:OmpA family protein [Deltaproteobacteria bacterium]
MRSHAVLAALMTGAAVWSPVALAQDSDTFNFSGDTFDSQGTLQLAHPKLDDAGSYYAGLGLSYANDPLVIRYEGSDTDTTVVQHQFGTRLHGGYNLNNWFRADVEIPFYVVGSPQDGVGGARLGDLRLGALVPLLTYEEEGVGVAVKPYFNIPTGQAAKDSYLSNGFGAGLLGTVGGETGELGWRANLGMEFSGAQTINVENTEATIETLDVGTNLFWGAGANYTVAEDLRVGAELTSVIDAAAGLGPWNANPMEAHIYGTYGGDEGILATLGLGTGLIAGVGAPDFRLVLGVNYRQPGGPPDTDLDGLTDDIDACPMEAEDKDNFEDADGCPELDNDADGIVDTADSCPMEPEDKDNFEDDNGCPDPDNDGDGLLDADDRCPLKPGPKETQGCPDNDSDGLANQDDECPDEAGPKETNGCPDRDNDRVPDKRDKCPDQAIDVRAEASRSDGCPSRVIVTKEKIEILDVIYFDYNKATIKKVSYPLLADIAKVINENPDLTLIEVGGHTDSDGSNAANIKLSQARAESVVKHLETIGGVKVGTLKGVGYGEEKPVVENNSDANKAKNRRVEFVIKERKAGSDTVIQEKPATP